MRAKTIISAGLTVVVLAVLAVVWLWPRTLPKITQEQVNRIRPAMTLAEVEAVLGCPPGNHTYHHGVPAVEVKQKRREAFKQWAAESTEPHHADANGSQGREAIVV